MVHHGLCAQCADGCADSVGHQHEEALCAGTDLLICLHIDIEGAGNVEEVESHAVDNAGEDEHPHARTGVAGAEEAEAEYPGEHCDEHHLLDAEELHCKRNEENAESLGNLRDGDEGIGILCSPGVCELGNFLEMGDERIGEAVGNLEGYAEQH